MTVPPGDSTTPVTVTFTAGAGTARLTVATPADEVAGPDRTLTATLAAGSGYTLGAAASASVTVQDDDPDGQTRPPGLAPGFAYVAYDLTGLNGGTLATEAVPEVIPQGTLPIPFADPGGGGCPGASGNEPAVAGTVTLGQCDPIGSPAYPTRYAALAGVGIAYRIDLQGDNATAGHRFAVDFAAEMAFSGMPNVLSGDYSYVLRRPPACSARPVPGSSRSAPGPCPASGPGRPGRRPARRSRGRRRA